MEKFETLLKKLPIPKKRIECYGHQVVVTCVSRDSASRWVMALNRVLGRDKVTCIESVDVVEKKTCLVSRYQSVYRIYGRV